VFVQSQLITYNRNQNSVIYRVMGLMVFRAYIDFDNFGNI